MFVLFWSTCTCPSLNDYFVLLEMDPVISVLCQKKKKKRCSPESPFNHSEITKYTCPGSDNGMNTWTKEA